jgi:F420-dependent methylenetetrahydromethanopterin dehydrogenase
MNPSGNVPHKPLPSIGRYRQTSSYPKPLDPVKWVEDEVLNQHGVGKAIDAFIRTLLRDGQATHRTLQAQLDWATSNVQDGDKIRMGDVVRAVQRHVEGEFGEDPLAKAIARAIATGDYLF